MGTTIWDKVDEVSFLNESDLTQLFGNTVNPEIEKKRQKKLESLKKGTAVPIFFFL